MTNFYKSSFVENIPYKAINKHLNENGFLFQDIWHELNLDLNNILNTSFIITFLNGISYHNFESDHIYNDNYYVKTIKDSNLCQEIVLYNDEKLKEVDLLNFDFLFSKQSQSNKEKFFRKNIELLNLRYMSKSLFMKIFKEGNLQNFYKNEQTICYHLSLKQINLIIPDLHLDNIPNFKKDLLMIQEEEESSIKYGNTTFHMPKKRENNELTNLISFLEKTEFKKQLENNLINKNNQKKSKKI